VKSDPSLAGMGLELIKTLLTDCDLDVRISASKTFAEIMKCDPTLAVNDLELIKSLI
jgi:hypothetical protein